MKKTFLLWMLMLLLCLPLTGIAAEAGDFVIAATDGVTTLVEGTDYSYADDELTVTTTTPVTIGLKTGIVSTENTIAVDSASGETLVAFHNVVIDTEEDEAITVKGANKVTFEFSGTNSIESASSVINVSSETPFAATSTNSGALSISNAKFGVFLDGYSSGGSVEISGSLKLSIQGCSDHAIYCRNTGTVTIIGTPVINIDVGEYAIYAHGINIYGGSLSVKNDTGYPICAANNSDIMLGGNAQVHIAEGGGGLRASGTGKITITDQAKYTVYSEDTDGNKKASIKSFPLISNSNSGGTTEISKNAMVKIYSANDGISGGKLSILDNAQVTIFVDTESSSSEYIISFSDTLTISGNAQVKASAINGTKVRGVNRSSGTMNVSGNAKVSIEGTTYDGIYVKALNLSDQATVIVNAASDNAVYGDIFVQDTASLTASTTDTRVIYDPCTITPAQDKAYMVRYGKSEVEASVEYYTAATTVDDKSTWRYFQVKPVEICAVTASANPTEGGTVDGAGTYEKGATATLTVTASEGYTFTNWTENGSVVSGEEIYTFTVNGNRNLQANFELNKYTIKFVNTDGEVLQSSEVEYGATPEYTGATPTKSCSDQYTYIFAGWDKQFEAVTGETTYTATYTSTINKYTIKFVNEDGTELQSSQVEYGATPIYGGATPVKPADAQYTYTFSGWSPEVVSVTGEATYTAIFSNGTNSYTVTWVDEDGITVLEKDENVPYGTLPTYDGEKPIKSATEQYSYTFVGWDKVPATVTGNAVYKAVYVRNVNTYIVRFEANGGAGDPVIVKDVTGSYTLPACNFAAPEGMQFRAWLVNGVKYAPGAQIEVSNELTIKAVWEAIPVTSTPPQTGDDSRITLWLIMSVISVVGMLAMLRAKKRRTE